MPCMDFGAFYGNTPMSDRDKEYIALCSEPLLDAFLNTGDLDQKLLVEAIAKRQIFPVLFGSALKVQGVKELLRLMQDYMRQPSWGQDFAARCFKIGRDEKGNRLTYLKILGGAMHIKDNLSYTIPFAGTDGGYRGRRSRGELFGKGKPDPPVFRGMLRVRRSGGGRRGLRYFRLEPVLCRYDTGGLRAGRTCDHRTGTFL